MWLNTLHKIQTLRLVISERAHIYDLFVKAKPFQFSISATEANSVFLASLRPSKTQIATSCKKSACAYSGRNVVVVGHLLPEVYFSADEI